MAKTNFQTVDEYLLSLPADVRPLMEEVRAAIHAAVPDAEEVISYQIAAIKSHGWIFYFSAHAKHYSLSCPPPFTVFEKFAKELEPYSISKSSIRFPLDEPVPTELITAMSKFRLDQNIEREKRTK